MISMKNKSSVSVTDKSMVSIKDDCRMSTEDILQTNRTIGSVFITGKGSVFKKRREWSIYMKIKAVCQ